jgi:hypothetical protein
MKSRGKGFTESLFPELCLFMAWPAFEEDDDGFIKKKGKDMAVYHSFLLYLFFNYDS